MMLLGAVIGVTRGGNFITQNYRSSTSSYFVARAAVAEMQARFAADPNLETDQVDISTAFGNGSYTVRFADDQSVNNLKGGTPKTGPYGEVQPGSALLRIHTKVGALSRTYDVLLSGQPGDQTDGVALLASGRIAMRGKVTVDGMKSYTDDSNVRASVVSNDPQSRADVITWNPANAGDTALVTGSVQHLSSHSQAVNLAAGAQVMEGTKQLNSAKNPPTRDIVGEVEANDTLPAPPSSGTLAGDFYQDGDFTYDGDLVLDGANLYIDGDLTINGSITGSGQVYVTGDTTFKGDAKLQANGGAAALFSHGDVELTGFDGTAYLEGRAGDVGGDMPEVLANAQKDIQAIIDEIKSGAVLDEHSPLDHRMRSLGQNDSSGHPDNPGDAKEQDKLRRLLAMVKSQPDSPTKAFMVEKLEFLRSDAGDYYGGVFGFFRKPHHAAGDEGLREAVKEVIAGTTMDGMVDAINDLVSRARTEGHPEWLDDFGGEDALRAFMVNSLEQISFDRLGTSYFQGEIYTNGFFYSANEVDVIGRINVVDDGSQESGSPQSNPGLTLDPGDVYFDTNTRVIYIDEPISQTGIEGNLGVKYWLNP